MFTDSFSSYCTIYKNDERIYEVTGYKRVNAITNIEEISETLKQAKNEIKVIEDFYDTEWNYIRTDITHSQFNGISGEECKIDILEPSTILIPENFELNNMTKEEQEKVKEHIQSFIDKL